MGGQNPQEEGIVALFKETLDGLGRLIGDHMKLARAELTADAKEYGRRVAFLALAVSLLLFGYALGCVAGALALSRYLGAPLAFLAVAGVHLLGGGIAVYVVIAGFQQRPPLDETLAELDRTVTALSVQDPTPHRTS
jgi:hypothetical protein